MRIEIGGNKFYFFHERWCSVGNIFQRAKNIVGKATWSGKHSNLILRT